MARMDGCQCGGWKRGEAASCDDCNGENARRSFAVRSHNLTSCLTAAALEELRVRAAVERIAAATPLAGLVGAEMDGAERGEE